MQQDSCCNKEFDSVISMNKCEGGWLAEVEVLERKSVPDTQDILGRYEMKFDDGGELLGYKRIMLRRRSDMEMVAGRGVDRSLNVKALHQDGH